MNIMRVTWKPGLNSTQNDEDFVFHKYALLSTAQRVLERRRRHILSMEFFPGDALTEKEIAQAISEDRFIGN